jgi:hypothetical protein
MITAPKEIRDNLIYIIEQSLAINSIMYNKLQSDGININDDKFDRVDIMVVEDKGNIHE